MELLSRADLERSDSATANNEAIKKPAKRTGQALFSDIKSLFLPCLVCPALTRPAPNNRPGNRHNIGFRVIDGIDSTVYRLQGLSSSVFGGRPRRVADNSFHTSCFTKAIFAGCGPR